MTLLAIEKMKSCKDCPHVHIFEWKIDYKTYYCDKSKGKFISGQKKNPKVNVPKWCPLRKFDLIK